MEKYPYLDMICCDGSGVAVERWNNSWSVDMHCHDYYELMLVSKGSCRHAFHGVETLLIPGDAVMIPAHEAHGYALCGEISIYNCQFIPKMLSEDVQRIIRTNSVREEQNKEPLDTATIVQRESMHAKKLPGYEVNSSKQGVIHLNPSDMRFIISLIDRAIKEQNEADSDFEIIKRKYVELILIEVQKKIDFQNDKANAGTAGSQRIIAEILGEIEENLAEAFDIEETARRYAFTPNYLRKLFKDYTGLSPIQYINRLRMIHACECLGKNHMSIKEAAEYVGIYDLNYFSRMFKKIIGCSPSKI